MRSKGRWIALLTLLTATVHLTVGLLDEAEWLLVVNGVGYLVLLGLWMRPPALWSRDGFRWLFIGYTAATILGYFAVDGIEGLYDLLGMLTKGLEVVLLGLLLTERAPRARRTVRP